MVLGQKNAKNTAKTHWREMLHAGSQGRLSAAKGGTPWQCMLTAQASMRQSSPTIGCLLFMQLVRLTWLTANITESPDLSIGRGYKDCLVWPLFWYHGLSTSAPLMCSAPRVVITHEGSPLHFLAALISSKFCPQVLWWIPKQFWSLSPQESLSALERQPGFPSWDFSFPVLLMILPHPGLSPLDALELSCLS